MELDRRTLLGLSAGGITGTLAGCTADDAPESTPESGDSEEETDDTPTSTAAPTSTPDSDDSEEDPDKTQAEILEIGETATFSDGESEISFTPLTASFHDVLIAPDNTDIQSTAPESSGQTFLTINVEIENTGSVTTNSPRIPILTLDGSQYERVIPEIYGDPVYENPYSGYQEIRPGLSVTSWLVYSVEYAEGTASLIAETSDENSVVTWEFDTAELERETFDYSDLSLGEDVSLGTEERQYRITSVNAETTQWYSYTAGGEEYIEEAGDGNKLVLVTVIAENTGTEVVRVPRSPDTSLLSGSSQYESDRYFKPEGYEGGEISSGIVREGIVQFEVPEPATDYKLQVKLTQDIFAKWDL